MANFFKQPAGYAPISERQLMERRYASARSNLLVAIVFTLINIVLTVVGSGTYFLFSIFVPYYMTEMMWTLCGKYPPEYYEDYETWEFLPDEYLIGAIVIAFVILAIYGLAWGLSKKRPGWMIAALVFVAIDTVVMLWLSVGAGLGAGMIIDVLFHIWVLVYMILGVQAHFKLKTLPPDEEIPVTPEMPEDGTAAGGEGNDENAETDETAEDASAPSDSASEGESTDENPKDS